MHFQRTIKREIGCRSIGLHTGRKVAMAIRPADVDQGIVFVRKDLPGEPRIKAELNSVCETTLATTIGCNGATVSTVEHLMSAFSGMGVDNAVVELDSFEVPIMDGSSQPFVNLLKDVGACNQGKCKKLLVIKEPVSVFGDNGSSASFLPSPEFKITYTIDFTHPAIGQQEYHMHFSDVVYEKEIASARTFGFLKDLEYFQAVGLALGGSLSNAVVLDDTRVINKGGLRSTDEFVKHKILDAIGDLSLLGMPIIGHFVAYKSGHRLNNLLLKELIDRKDSWSIVSRYNREDSGGCTTSLNIPTFGILDAVQHPASRRLSA
jgi:UDP-3-O-[3-hydroxymyristoyl] N-acetylglucosamine deacetylase